MTHCLHSENRVSITAKTLTSDELRDGYTVCACGKYAHVFRAEVLRRLPVGYNGELCKECHMWMCAIDHL